MIFIEKSFQISKDKLSSSKELLWFVFTVICVQLATGIKKENQLQSANWIKQNSIIVLQWMLKLKNAVFTFFICDLWLQLFGGWQAQRMLLINWAVFHSKCHSLKLFAKNWKNPHINFMTYYWLIAITFKPFYFFKKKKKVMKNYFVLLWLPFHAFWPNNKTTGIWGVYSSYPSDDLSLGGSTSGTPTDPNNEKDAAQVKHCVPS